ncbi:hypothetical protein BGZ51_004867 [Haplosporangium sp. Z 767]|nr:hypothetical protein BGZ51_004867 [Haplosporangium sp. Z 767]
MGLDVSQGYGRGCFRRLRQNQGRVKTAGVKPQKPDRVSVVLCTNATGEYMPQRLCEYTKAQVETQPGDEERVSYMYQHSFIGWLRRSHADIVARSPQRQILLLIDSTPGRMIIADPAFMDQIPNIRIITLPKNSTSVTQPLNTGLITVFKNYHQGFLAISATVHRKRIENSGAKGAFYIPNNIAWKHIVQA